MAKLLCVVFDTDMRSRHEGLLIQAKKAGVDIDKFKKTGSMVAFLNTKKDRVMVLTFRNIDDKFGIMGYYRNSHGRVMPEAIQYIPHCFGGDGFDMDKATKLALEDLLARKSRDPGR